MIGPHPPFIYRNTESHTQSSLNSVSERFAINLKSSVIIICCQNKHVMNSNSHKSPVVQTCCNKKEIMCLSLAYIRAGSVVFYVTMKPYVLI